MNTPLTLTLLVQIAQWRVQGLEWSLIAQQLGVDEPALRTQLREQHEPYQQALLEAKQEMLDELFITCVATLRKVMNGESQPKEAAGAAKALLRICTPNSRQGARIPPAPLGAKSEPQTAYAPVNGPAMPPPVVPAEPVSRIEPSIATTNAEPVVATLPPKPVAPKPVASETITPKTILKNIFGKSMRPFLSHSSG